MPSYRRKLIEVALPLEAINEASSREKSIRHGHPSTLHLWWARRPLATARAVIFSQTVDDPSEYVDELLADPATRSAAEKVYKTQLKTWQARKIVFDKAQSAGMSTNSNPNPGTQLTLEETAANLERERLFAIIEDLVVWENTTNEKVLQQARDEISRSWRRTCAQNASDPRAKELFNPDKLPAFHDPFAGGGALPLEAQRLGLEAYASDLNPVAVLINKAMIEIPPKFAGRPPVNPKSRAEMELMPRKWKGAQGLAEDVRYYGKWMRDEAEKRIGHLYPKVEITAEIVKERPDLKKYVGQKLTVIAWIWARTVKSPNPAFSQIEVPLASTFMLSTKAGKEVYVEPVIENDGYRFTVKAGKPKEAELAKNGTKVERGSNFRCLMSGTPIAGDYIMAVGKAGHIGMRLMAIVADGDRERVYLAPTQNHEDIARQAKPKWKPDVEFFQQALGFRVGNYGMAKWSDLFAPRQLVALTTLMDLVIEVRELIRDQAGIAGFSSEPQGIELEGMGATAYSEAVSVFLAFVVDRAATMWSSLSHWMNDRGAISGTFGLQVLSMIWDFVEGNPFSDSAGNIVLFLDKVAMAIETVPASIPGHAFQDDAAKQTVSKIKVVSTDPPYFDNVGYADLSDFFYVWLRSSLKSILPKLLSTLTTPKTNELVATPARHGGKKGAEAFFMRGMTEAMCQLADRTHPNYPVTIYYAFKQSESNIDGTASTGWESFLESVIRAGFGVTGTWPIRTEQAAALKTTRNALASSIILVCRPRAADALISTRRDFVNALKIELPLALAHLQGSNIAPVDLAQAAIGPGMAIFTRYQKILDAQGQPLTVRQGLALINQTLDEALAEQEGDFDADTRWALAWFDQSGFSEGEFGVADVLARAKDTSVAGMVEAGIIASSRGKVRLLKPAELPEDWDPTTDKRLTTWETVHQLIRVLEASGENSAAALVAKLGINAETARELCYRLYTICERKKRNAEALSYNGLVQSWPEIIRLARSGAQPSETQATLL